MRYFHSYGPVDCQEHFCVARTALIDNCIEQLIGNPQKGGHYFTLWAPRQSGKTWVMQQVAQAVKDQYKELFHVAMMSMQGIVMEQEDSPDVFLDRVPHLFRRAFKQRIDRPRSWEELSELFLADSGLFDRPVILLIDEFDKLPALVIDRLVSLFRDMYLDRSNFVLHGLALIGVRAVLGVDSERGSPFNVQRSLHVPNFTKAEVSDLFGQYQTESGQKVSPEVVNAVHAATCGQPGLVCWFGELLTTKFNPGQDKVIDMAVWEETYLAVVHTEWNNSILNLIKKAQSPYLPQVLDLFTRSDLPFSIRAEWCSYLYLLGVIDKEKNLDGGAVRYVCRFASPYIQTCLYNALTRDLMGERPPILPLEPMDELLDVFSGPELNLPALLDRYVFYLQRLKDSGLNPWHNQPRRTDLHYTEYVGHFHLYAWLQNAVQDYCIVSPEFPTGNGRVDLHLKCTDKEGVIEVKNYTNQAKTKRYIQQAASYASNLTLPSITIALFVPLEDETILARLSKSYEIAGVQIVVRAIGWV
ncbi:AAA-like domain-containing protein [Desulfonatronovibrio magnus]|uniref:AAA-like domain-containing protein n=1 Tax=Desulfonatronovibrio magnus TaxID=698827 RepID=UPI0005EADEBB|nr:AAA-like domain-containing protein [Desulfonatronovibrio magnus]